jgi:2'-5' RNA ligase
MTAPAEPTTLPTGWRGPMMPLNTRSGDGREFILDDDAEPGVRPLPLPLNAQKQLAAGHDGSIVAGLITRVWVQDGYLWGEGPFDLDDPEAADWAAKVGRGMAGWVSVDMSDLTVQQVPLDPDGTEVPEQALADYETAMAAWTGGGSIGDPPTPPTVASVLYRVPSWKLMGCTLVSSPAFESARIEPVWGEEFAPVHARQALVAAAAQHTGAMVALIPSDEDCQRLAVDGYEPAEVLHTTLVFLGDAAGWSPEHRDQIEAAVRGLDFTAPISGSAWATAQFNPNGDDPCAVYLVGAEGRDLDTLQSTVQYAIEDLGSDGPDDNGAPGIPTQHHPWIPHVTIGYGLDAAQLTETGPVRFDRIRLSFADTDVRDIHLEPLTTSLTASGIVYDATDFDLPEPDDYTLLTVTDDGRVFGHLAPWGTCHSAFPDNCVTPPFYEDDDYNAFHQGGPIATTAGLMRVGKVTFGTGHADMRLGAQGALAHYDNTGTIGAIVRCRNGEHGPFLSGRLMPGLTDEQINIVRVAAVSGDWRRLRANAHTAPRMELIAALSVNSPGFMAPRARALVASGVQSLVASGGYNLPENGEPITLPPTRPRLDLDALRQSLDRQARCAQAAARIGQSSVALTSRRTTAAAAKTDDQKAKPLERYWTQGAGLARWARGAHPYTQLVKELRKEIPPGEMTDDQVHGLAANYYHKVFGRWPGKSKDEKSGRAALERADRVAHAAHEVRIARVDAIARRLGVAADRHVRTPSGAEFYGKPVGAKIKGGTPAAPDGEGEDPEPAGAPDWATNPPFPKMVRDYKADTVDDVKPATALQITDQMNGWLRHHQWKNEHDGTGTTDGETLADFDVVAAENDIVRLGLNVPHLGGSDTTDDEYDQIGSAMWDVLQQHRIERSDTPDTDVPDEVFGPRRTVADTPPADLIAAYTDVARALDANEPTAPVNDEGTTVRIGIDDYDMPRLVQSVIRTGLNVRALTSDNVSDDTRTDVAEQFDRLLNRAQPR